MNNERISSQLRPSSQPRPSRWLPRRSIICPSDREWHPSWGAWFSGDRVHFRVWAPHRTTVEVLLERPRQGPVAHSLEKRPDGTFFGSHPLAHAGALYRYRVDGKNVYPDPASRFQPEGVHGPSQIIDPRPFHWTDASWTGVPLEDLVIYELHVGAFSPEGTYEGIIRRLSHLVQLGVTAIELMPLADFAGLRNWGYDGVALYSPARCYGTPDELRQLINAAHHVGLAVLLDVVYNHMGPDGNYTGIFSPYYVTPRPHGPWGQSLRFYGEPSEFVRDVFIQNALHWVHEYHIDCLRL